MGNGDGGRKDWVLPMNFEIDPNNYSMEQIEKAVKTGFRIEKDGNTGKARVVERVVIKGDKKTDNLDVSK